MKDFKAITFEVIDININTSPDIYINRNSITFSKKVLEDLNYPANVQYCVSAEDKVFAIRVCKSNEAKPTPFSKSKTEQNTTLSTSNKNLVDTIKAMMPNGYKQTQRYKVTGVLDADSRTMYYDLDTAVIDTFRQTKEEQ